MTDTMRRVAVNGAELGYAVHGVGADKPALVFTHGYAMRSTSGPYDELLELLAHDYVVHALDLRGHGASATALENWSFETLADDVAAFCGSQELIRPVFVGHSFGAVIGLYAELRHPGAFSALCLLSPGPADHRNDPPAALDFMIEHGRDRETLRGGFARMFVHPSGQLLDRTLDAVTALDPEVHRALKRHNPTFSIDDRLETVEPPALLICGERDQVVPALQQHDMARKLSRSKEVVFSNEGHMLPNESPALAAREILAFLYDVRASLGAESHG